MELDPLSYTEVKVDWRTSEETTWDQCKVTHRDPLMLYEILCMRISIIKEHVAASFCFSVLDLVV